MHETALRYMKRRFRNQLANLVTSGAILTCLVLGIVLGTVAGIHLAKAAQIVWGWGDAAKALAVIILTLAGFATGLFTAYGVSPRLVRFAFSARASRDSVATAILNEIRLCHRGLEIRLYEIDDGAYPIFGANVVVAGITFGRGFFRPAIFAAQSVLRTCPPDELHAIFAHEVAHLSEWHLFKRIRGAFSTFLVATFFTSLLVVGLQWSGYVQVAALTAAISGLIPAILTWIHTRVQMREQEKEADRTAIEVFGAETDALLSALERLTARTGAPPHPYVAERMAILKQKLTPPEQATERLAA